MRTEKQQTATTKPDQCRSHPTAQARKKIYCPEYTKEAAGNDLVWRLRALRRVPFGRDLSRTVKSSSQAEGNHCARGSESNQKVVRKLLRAGRSLRVGQQSPQKRIFLLEIGQSAVRVKPASEFCPGRARSAASRAADLIDWLHSGAAERSKKEIFPGFVVRFALRANPLADDSRTDKSFQPTAANLIQPRPRAARIRAGQKTNPSRRSFFANGARPSTARAAAHESTRKNFQPAAPGAAQTATEEAATALSGSDHVERDAGLLHRDTRRAKNLQTIRKNVPEQRPAQHGRATGERSHCCPAEETRSPTGSAARRIAPGKIAS